MALVCYVCKQKKLPLYVNMCGECFDKAKDLAILEDSSLVKARATLAHQYREEEEKMVTCNTCGLKAKELHNIWGCCNACEATADFIASTKRIPKHLALSRLKHAVESTAEAAKLPKPVQDSLDYETGKTSGVVTSGIKPGGSPKLPKRLYMKSDGGHEAKAKPLSSEEYRKLEFETNEDEGLEAFRSKKEMIQFLYALADVALLVGDQEWFVEIAKESKQLKEMK